MKSIVTVVRHIWRNRNGALGNSRKRGLTLVELVFASAISLLLFLTLLESLSVCQRMALNVKWRLAADAIAYDTVWEKFNLFTTPLSFSDAYPKATNGWIEVPANQNVGWYAGGKAYKYWEITPVGVPASNWVIRSNVRWPIPGGKYATNTAYYVIERYWINRKLFYSTD